MLTTFSFLQTTQKWSDTSFSGTSMTGATYSVVADSVNFSTNTPFILATADCLTVGFARYMMECNGMPLSLLSIIQCLNEIIRLMFPCNMRSNFVSISKRGERCYLNFANSCTFLRWSSIMRVLKSSHFTIYFKRLWKGLECIELTEMPLLFACAPRRYE